jgi:anti-sigma B factor antagonist
MATDHQLHPALRPCSVRERLTVVVTAGPLGPSISAAGELDIETASMLREAILDAVGHHEVVLDLTGLEFMDSTGVHLLLETRERLRRGATDLRVVVCTRVLRVLSLVGLQDVFDVRVRPAPVGRDRFAPSSNDASPRTRA